MYSEKRDRHREQYFRHLAQKMRSRFPAMSQEAEEMAEKLKVKKEGDRMRRFNAFLARQKANVAQAEKRLRKSLSRKKKKEEVEP